MSRSFRLAVLALADGLAAWVSCSAFFSGLLLGPSAVGAAFAAADPDHSVPTRHSGLGLVPAMVCFLAWSLCWSPSSCRCDPIACGLASGLLLGPSAVGAAFAAADPDHSVPTRHSGLGLVPAMVCFLAWLLCWSPLLPLAAGLYALLWSALHRLPVLWSSYPSPALLCGLLWAVRLWLGCRNEKGRGD